MEQSKIKIFMGTNEVAGVMLRLKNGFVSHQIHATFACLEPYKFAHDKNLYRNEDLKFVDLHLEYVELKKKEANYWKRKILDFKITTNLIKLFLYALSNYNTFLYIYGNGIFSYLPKKSMIMYKLEFILLKIFRKKVIMWYCGTDSRAPYTDAFYEDIRNKYKYSKMKKTKVSFIDKWATIRIDNPASAHFHTKEYIIYQIVGIPVDAYEIAEEKLNHVDKIIKILHAPSNFKVKGTEEIRKTVNVLIEKGYPIQYIEKSGVSHDEILIAISEADIVIDQIYSDTPMAGFATEAALNAKPVITAGYFAAYSKKILEEYHPPSIYCHPDELEENIVNLINNKEYRIEIGKKAKEFVEKHYHIDRVVTNFCNLIQGEIPNNWYFNPYNSEYIWGGGCKKELVIEYTQDMIDKFGVNSLFINDKNRLLSRYLEEIKQYRKNNI